ncbi:hypothetical protein HRI_001258800 [Hibiscus trionum]|uniref:Uncharacterized protein n=1 Tax=Hibiscus trionum TaxID=183268 RepID=A0A9W7HHG7_HIBTR|nr:hypothetical protein HRI_001258800 [Hibiscus trionum]
MEVKRRTARNLVAKLSSVSEQIRTKALCELRLISKHDPESRPLIADAGAVSYLSETLYGSSPTIQENAASTLLNLSITSRASLMSTRGFFDALSHALSNSPSPSVESGQFGGSRCGSRFGGVDRQGCEDGDRGRRHDSAGADCGV